MKDIRKEAAVACICVAEAKAMMMVIVNLLLHFSAVSVERVSSSKSSLRVGH